MNKYIFNLRRCRAYRQTRLFIYYAFQYRRRNRKIKKIVSGEDDTFAYLRQYRGIHSGQRCFIIGTAPSLTQEDLELVRNEYTIGVNALCMKFKEMDWKTSYFVISDFKAYQKLSPVLRSCNMPFFSAHKSEVKDDLCTFIPTDIHNNYMLDYEKKEFTNNIEQGCGNGNTVILQAIQIAAYMGFSQIYLLGVDCNYNQKDKMYFVDHGIRQLVQEGAGLRMIADFKTLKKYMDQWHIKIYNAAQGGMLEVFPRVNLKDVVVDEVIHE